MAMLRIKRYLKVGGKKCWRVTRAGNVKRKQNYSTVLPHQEEFSLIRKERKALKPQITEALGLKHLGSILDYSVM